MLRESEPLHDFQNLKLPRDTPRGDTRSGGFVIEAYKSAWRAIKNSCNLGEVLILAVSRGNNADTLVQRTIMGHLSLHNNL